MEVRPGARSQRTEEKNRHLFCLGLHGHRLAPAIDSLTENVAQFHDAVKLYKNGVRYFFKERLSCVANNRRALICIIRC